MNVSDTICRKTIYLMNSPVGNSFYSFMEQYIAPSKTVEMICVGFLCVTVTVLEFLHFPFLCHCFDTGFGSSSSPCFFISAFYMITSTSLKTSSLVTVLSSRNMCVCVFIHLVISLSSIAGMSCHLYLWLE